MRTHIRLLSLAVALSASVFLIAAMPAHPIATGNATILASTPGVGPLQLDFSLIELPNGILVGSGEQYAPDVLGYVEYDLTSYELINGVMCMAGPITQSVNSPFPVGATWILCLEDNSNGGSGAADRIATAVLPPGLTIQIIQAAFPGFLPPPDSKFTTVMSGNVKIH